MAALDVGKSASGRRAVDHSLPLVPFIDFLLCLVAFLLVTAVWTHASRLEASANVPGLESVTPEAEVPRLHVTLKERVFALEWRKAGTVTDSREVARKPMETGQGDLSYPLLAEAIQREWQAHASTRPEPMQAVVHSPNSTSFRDLVAAIDAVRATRRQTPGGKLAAFEVTLAAR